jgi:hypothetical protein
MQDVHLSPSCTMTVAFLTRSKNSERRRRRKRK